MTRRLVKSDAYRRVLALDYSEAMLRETRRRFGEESVSTDALTLCRADVAALPLQPGAVDAMHAGAAMHCWPQLEEGLAQIYAALKPEGGRFFATTFLQVGAIVGLLVPSYTFVPAYLACLYLTTARFFSYPPPGRIRGTDAEADGRRLVPLF